MATTTRIYTVFGKDEQARLVRAPNSAQALRHVAADTLTVEVASQDQLVTLASAGVKVEETTAKDATQ
jgi:hypothetical protein